jgi:BirA family transcriptional regulator, biotin operon repressor / biotin---[acetyl-CoA-carboxylase] ligase
MPIPPPTAEWSLPTRHIGRRVLYYERIPSTLTVAASLTGEPGTAVLAGEQTAGRGQFGRTWHCPPGAGILLAIALAPPPSARRPAVLTAWAAVGVSECIHRLTGLEPRIKWPNDVLISDKKVCGILIESAASGPVPIAVAGIGVNVAQSAADFTAAGLPDATSLAASAEQSFETTMIAQALLEDLDRAYALFDGGLAALETMWRDGIGLLGRPVTVETNDGTILAGNLQNLTFAGLRLKTGPKDVELAPEAVRHLMPG